MIRPARPEDREFITALAHEFDRFGPYVRVFAAMLDGTHAVLAPLGVTDEVALFVHEDDAGQGTGFVAVEWKQRVAHIHGVVVDARFRRQGVATQLLEYVKQLALHRRTLTLECITAETDNAPALRCFTQWGFQNMGLVGSYPYHQPAVGLCRELE
jgi:GNAT superfamily N-acetyltransferase